MAIDPGKVGLIWPCLDRAIISLSNDAGVVKSSCRKVIREVSGGAPTVDESAASNPSARP